MSTFLDYVQKVAASAVPIQDIVYGPWEGSMRSISADLVPKEFIAGGNEFLYRPRYGSWKRRGGQTIKFDTLPTTVGLIPAKWGAKARDLQEFISESVSDSIPTVICLLTKETVTSGTDDGRFSQVWVRDQVNSLNYALGSEYSSVTYPAPGSTASYLIVPLWYDSGDGGLTRGAGYSATNQEFAQRFFVPGSRKMLKVGNWWYFPSLLGTPSRWRARFTAASQAAIYLRPSDTFVASTWTGQDSGTSLHTYIDETSASDADYITQPSGSLPSCQLGLSDPSSTPSSSAPHVIRVRVKMTDIGGSPDPTFNFTLTHRGGAACVTSTGNVIGTSFSTIEYALNSTEITAIGGTYTDLDIIFAATGIGANGYFQVSWFELAIGTSATSGNNANRLIPSGPIPPCHAGSAAKGNVASGSGTTTVRPDADITDGAWLNQAASAVNLYQSIDDATTDDTDYIQCTVGGALGELSIANPTFAVTSATHTVGLRYRALQGLPIGNCRLTVNIYEGAVLKATSLLDTSTAYFNQGYAFTSTEINSISDWTTADLRIRFTATQGSGSALDAIRVSNAYLDITAITSTTEGGWKGSDRFYWGVAYRFEDDSVWMPTLARGPSSTLTSGLNLFTVDSSNTSTRYDSVVYSNLPVPPHGVKSILLMRTPKIDSTVTDNLVLNPYDLRVIEELSAGTTTYTDYFSDDESLTLDVEKAFVRFDHIMTPRARYMFGGDMRACVNYGGATPCAIVIAPVGHVTDYDLNVADTSSTAYSLAVGNMYMRMTLSSAGVGTLELGKSDGTTLTLLSLSLTTYNTLQKLVDRINATSCSNADAQQWRAQLCPGADPDAVPTTALTPHSRVIASCVVSGQTITKAAGGLGKVAVGALISGTGVTTGAYVSVITSDTSLTFVGTITAATKDLTFYFELGDSPTAATANTGYQRVACNALPGFLYFNSTYLGASPLDKNATWMTVASPGSVKSAPNCWSGEVANKFTPPLEAGIAMGGAAVDQGFVIFYAKKRGAIRPRGPDQVTDQDYGLHIINDTSGCVAWSTIAAGNRCAFALAPEGIVACDLYNEVLISRAIYAHPISDATTGVGDFSFEIPKCVAATAMDIDYSASDSTIGAYAHAEVMRSTLFVNYRTSGSANNRQVQFDFSSADDLTGLKALMRSPGKPWGWSLPLTRSFSAMTEGRRSDGLHLYGWNDANAGSTGDGRIDEFETGTQDNGTDIANDGPQTPWFRPPDGKLVSGQEIILEHSSPAGSTGSLVFHRSFSDDSYSMTPSTSSLVVLRELKMLTTRARATANACYVEYKQATGSARELRKIVLRVKVLPTYR